MVTIDINSIGTQLLFTTIRLESQKQNGEIVVGTGFIVSSHDGEIERMYIITNKHIILGSIKCSLTFLLAEEGNPQFGKTISININIKNISNVWYFHPDQNIDLCLASFYAAVSIATNLGNNIFCKAIPLTIFLSEKEAEDCDVLEEICFVGYPVGLYDKKHYLPIFRTGTVASHINVDYNGMPVFLVDASVFPGSSGSPVFIYDRHSYRQGMSIIMQPRLRFVGVMTESIFFLRKGKKKINLNPKLTDLVDLGVVIKASEVKALIEEYDRRNNAKSS